MALKFMRACSLKNNSLLDFTKAGQKYRKSIGLSRSGNEEGPLHDWPDFDFVDGRPSPITPKQRYWLSSRIRLNLRIERLKNEMLLGAKKKPSEELKRLVLLRAKISKSQSEPEPESESESQSKIEMESESDVNQKL
eukprot:TRINITY_DN1504_c0_g2_i1.p1 TRINITY_DN1504_c0_g2~~TRINITY_DN1504_c0_g2_i1.p1  ORF type:complete len:137 (-),score=60.81 TRINITY_DN1504_c0_g2_i1:103-513(-)